MVTSNIIQFLFKNKCNRRQNNKKILAGTIHNDYIHLEPLWLYIVDSSSQQVHTQNTTLKKHYHIQ